MDEWEKGEGKDMPSNTITHDITLEGRNREKEERSRERRMRIT